MVTTSLTLRFDRAAIMRDAWSSFRAEMLGIPSWAKAAKEGRLPAVKHAPRMFGRHVRLAWMRAREAARLAGLTDTQRAVEAAADRIERAERAVWYAEGAETTGPGRSFDHAGLAAARSELWAARAAFTSLTLAA